jgi:hypothetical protein
VSVVYNKNNKHEFWKIVILYSVAVKTNFGKHVILYFLDSNIVTRRKLLHSYILLASFMSQPNRFLSLFSIAEVVGFTSNSCFLNCFQLPH